MIQNTHFHDSFYQRRYSGRLRLDPYIELGTAKERDRSSQPPTRECDESARLDDDHHQHGPCWGASLVGGSCQGCVQFTNRAVRTVPLGQTRVKGVRAFLHVLPSGSQDHETNSDF